jgi:prepilin-type N-terminal cleavage/methylation domain-containing protein
MSHTSPKGWDCQFRHDDHTRVRASRRSARRGAFTLIELLTVISIIAVVAGLVVGLAPGAARLMRTKRVEGDLNQLISAIEQYHAVKGYYPPDNSLRDNPPLVNSGTNALYYELKGWNYSSVDDRTAGTLERTGPLYTRTLQQVFHRGGIANSSAVPGDPNVKDFLPNLKTNQVFRASLGSFAVDLLKVPVPGPGGVLANPWHYVSTSPTNNPGKFDLWAEVQVGKDIRIIGNWKE